MALDERLALKIGKPGAALVSLVPPHVNHGFAIGSLETIDQVSVVLEMGSQGGPLSGKRPLHTSEFHLPPGGPRAYPVLSLHTRRNWGYYWRLKYDGLLVASM
jgi:hypothetical protein